MSLGAYLHVPYCLKRCGYCDFNTYSNLALGPGVSGYARAVSQEIALAASQLHQPVDTVFFGGGTPTVLAPADLAGILEALREICGVHPQAEITTEANPDTVDEASLEALAAAGFNRISVGMQSAVPHVLYTLNRTHQAQHLLRAVRSAQARGLRVSVDLIYGTPGESLEDWRRSVNEALDLGVEHVSCYALTIEPGTALGQRLRAGKIPDVDPDDQAQKYELADSLLSSAGLRWYEISNWAVAGQECRHNLNYWQNSDWYGFGPGAHSHLQQRRFWNLKHPARWFAQVSAGKLPVEEAETIAWGSEADWLEHVMLRLRTRWGLELPAVPPKRLPAVLPAELPAATHSEATAKPPAGGQDRYASWSEARCQQLWNVAGDLASQGLLEIESQRGHSRAVLTRHGRLLADTVTHHLSAV